MTGDGQRIDIFLWYARFAKSRAVAAEWAEAGTIRLNGRPIDKAHAGVRPGDVLTLARPGRIQVIRVLSLPARRGPAPEAAALVEVIEDQRI